ncbi:hypothetical protein AJ79_04953 [Helicocarpus griseus UAMH5409]|uniref:Uncharacterized protein n=1 Tax=Helicocarpus griseus UAMH5409 TaxID=1447875 RepID=A0A2B7XS79_9EURO|nr:hypothetical protein AJ79_04953 [Helicocarpus griseus UAMH5409]
MEPTTVSLKRRRRSSRSGQCLGLRIRLNDGTEAITSATHHYVRLPGKYQAVQRVLNWIITAKNNFSGLFRGSWLTWQDGVPANSPLGMRLRLRDGKSSKAKSVTNTVTTTYDNPSSMLPYPNGYQHDLSLLTGPNLPHITTPPDVGKITGWANYEEALDGNPVFVTRLETSLNNNTRERTAAGAAKEAIMEGTEYFWDKQGNVTAGLFWRTGEEDPEVVDHESGDGATVLCLGRPSDETVKAVVFQNYETPVRTYECEPGHYGHCTWKMKGGFILPPDIRECEIVSDGFSEKPKT